jgi:hypothetical protein
MDTLLAPNTTDALAWALKAYKAHGSHYGECRAYLDGDQPLSFATEKFKSAFGRQFKTFAYNRCAAVVDAHADRLQVEGFGSDNDALSQAAQDIWDSNQMDVREGMVEFDAFGLGDGYVIVEVDPTSGDVLIWPQYAENVRVQYSDTRPGLITQASRRWYDDDLRRLRLNLYFPDRIEKYASRREFTTGSSIDWNVKDYDPYQPDGEAWPVVLNLNDTVPVFHFGNNARINAYGQSELHDVIPLQDAINKTVMDMLVAMEFAAFPQRVVIGVDVEESATADSIQRFQAAIDRMLVLTGSDGQTPAIAEFSAAQMAQYLDVAEKFDQFISRVSRVPSRYLNQDTTQESGISKRMDESPFVSKIEDRQRAFGAVWADGVMRYCLRLQGMTVEPGDLRVNWKPAAPLSEDQQWELVTMKVAASMPFAAALREAGYEPDQIADIMADREAEQRASMVADFGGGIEDEGEAVA